MRIAWRDAILLSALFFAAVTGTHALRPGLLAHEVAGEHYDDEYYLPAPSRLHWMTLGFDQAAADLLWVRTLIYFGTEMQQRGSVRYAFDYVRAATTLDPYFRSMYLWAASAGIYRPTGLNAEIVRESITFLAQALTRFPNDGRLEWEMGATLAFELVPLVPASEKSAVQAQAAPHLARAVELRAAPAWVSMSSTTMLLRAGQTERAIRHLEELYSTIDDEGVRLQIADRLAQLRSSMGETAGVMVTRRFHEEHVHNYPYLSENLFYWIAPNS